MCEWCFVGACSDRLFGSDTVSGHSGQAADDSYPSRSWLSSSDAGQGRQRELVHGSTGASPGSLHPAPSPSSLAVSPKRRRLEAMDAHQSAAERESQPPSDQHVVPIIRVDEDTALPPAAQTGPATSKDDREQTNKPNHPSPSPVIADESVGPAANCHPDNDSKTLPADRKPSTDDI